MKKYAVIVLILFLFSGFSCVRSLKPTFDGINDIVLTIGESVAYKKGVTAKDSSGNEIPFTVDSSAVNRYKPGTYKITYKASDSDGNTASETSLVTVVSIELSDVREMAEGIESEILNSDMTVDEKLQQFGITLPMP